MLRFHTKAIELSFGTGGLPTEFRLFVAGWNETENGRFLFDGAAAKAVMAAYQAWGVDLAIDLEHQMLESIPTPDPTAKDARGWCKLELRPDGSLWAVGVRWTPDGSARLSEKRQRYVSPAFEIDPETKRVTKIINVAITAIPATHHTPALVAANAIRLSGGSMLDAETVKKALEALKNGDAEACMALLTDMIASAASGGEAEAPAEPAAEAAAVPAEEPASDPPAEEEEKKTTAAVSARLIRVTSTKDVTSALAVVDTWRTSHIELETERQKLAAERSALESAERRKLCVELIRLGAEFPATVWTDDKSSALKPRWASMPIEVLREHVSEQASARGGKSNPKPPTENTGSGSREFKTPHGVVSLSASELNECVRAGAKPEVYAANKAKRLQKGK